MPPVFGVLFDGLAYGMLLFLLSVGLSVTLGMMNFVNLAHCSFAMLGGYVTVTLMNALGWPFLATLPIAFVAAAATSVVLERVFFRRFYRASDLEQCLLTIGVVFGRSRPPPTSTAPISSRCNCRRICAARSCLLD